MAMCLTFLVALLFLGELSFASNTPGKPTDLRVTSVHDLTITLTWNKPLTTAGTPISSSLFYNVRYTAISSGSSLQESVSTENIQLPLRANTQYNIFVKAVRSDDHQIRGEWSKTFRVDSKNLVPAKPTNLRVIYVTGLTVKIAWVEPRTTVTGIPDSSSLMYKISYRNLASQATRQFSISSQAATLRLRLANTRYEIKVSAYKAFDPSVYGPWSEELTVKSNETVPSKPPTNVRLVSNTLSSITVSWGPIPKDGRNGIIRGFIVSYREEGAMTWTKRDVKLVYFQVLTSLATGKQYYVRVAGYTEVGRGSKSAAKSIIVGGQFITTTKKTTTQKPTTLKSSSTTRRTTTLSTKPSTLAPVTVATQKPQRTSTETTVTVQIDTLATVSRTKEPHQTTGVNYSQEPNRRTSTQSKSATKTETDGSVYQSTPAVALASKADKESKSGSLNEILLIGAPVAGGLLLLIILIAVFVSSRRRSRKRRLQNGEIPLQQERSRGAVTRGAFSIRYEPPPAHFDFTEDSMTEGLLQPSDEPVRVTILIHEPNGAVAEDAPLVQNGYLEKCKLSVDLNTEGSKLVDGQLYESIGSLGGAGCKTAANNDSGERYVTYDQMAVTRDKAPLEPRAKTPPQECNHFERCKGARAKAITPQGKIYENVQDSEHVYETLGLEGAEDPVYENTRVVPSPQENNRGEEAGYEPIPT